MLHKQIERLQDRLFMAKLGLIADFAGRSRLEHVAAIERDVERARTRLSELTEG